MYQYTIGMIFLAISSLAFAIAPATSEPIDQHFNYQKIEPSAYPQFSIIGNWTYIAPNSTCSETYSFQQDGTMRGSSGKQIVDSQYAISEKHTQYAFYALKHQVVTVNQQKDCEGELAEVGYEGLHYIRFDLTGDLMIMCDDESAILENCFGPLTRNK